MNELYYCTEEKRYRFKVDGPLVFIERQASGAYKALTQEFYPLDSFPVLNDRYWNEDQLNRLIAWYEADIWDEEPTFTTYPDEPAFSAECMPSPLARLAVSWDIEKSTVPTPGTQVICNGCLKPLAKCKCNDS